MSSKIENLTKRPVMIRFNSGQTLYLGSLEASVEIPDIELKANIKVKKLQDRGVIALHTIAKRQPPKPTKEEKATKEKELKSKEKSEPKEKSESKEKQQSEEKPISSKENK